MNNVWCVDVLMLQPFSFMLIVAGILCVHILMLESSHYLQLKCFLIIFIYDADTYLLVDISRSWAMPGIFDNGSMGRLHNNHGLIEILNLRQEILMMQNLQGGQATPLAPM